MTSLESAALAERPRPKGPGAGTVELPGLPGIAALHYLPEVDLRDGSVTHFEALLRWDHPQYGLLRPGASLLGTRWSDLLDDLEAWTFTTACEQAAAWMRDGLHLSVAVNASERFLLDDTFLDVLDGALASSQIAADRLSVDVPVRALAAAPLAMIDVTRELSRRGVAVNVDGIVEASQGRAQGALEHIIASTWKVDLRRAGRSGPIHPNVTSTLRWAWECGAATVAKAVEDDATRDEVRALGFDRAFGYALAPVVPRHEVPERYRPLRARTLGVDRRQARRIDSLGPLLA